MNQIVIEGTLRKNTRGRSHLVFRRRDGNAAVVRLLPEPDFPSGSTISVTGDYKGNLLTVATARLRTYPKRASRMVA